MTVADGRVVTPGRIVLFNSEKGMRPAIVAATADDVDIHGADVDSGATLPITKEGGVHLVVFDHAVKPAHGGTLVAAAATVAHDVAYAHDDGDGIPAGTWTWPPTV